MILVELKFTILLDDWWIRRYKFLRNWYDAIASILEDKDYYKGVYDIFNSITKDECIDNVIDIIKENPSEFANL